MVLLCLFIYVHGPARAFTSRVLQFLDLCRQFECAPSACGPVVALLWCVGGTSTERIWHFLVCLFTRHPARTAH